MTNFSRRYYEREFGAVMGVDPGGHPSLTGYSEPFRRFVQREQILQQANEIPNQMPSWLPGDDYFTNFRTGDPYVKIAEGYARLPGAGYEALHPEVSGTDPEDYPDITKLAILADVAPYSREFQSYRARVGKEVSGNTEAEIEYQQILERARHTKESILHVDERRFTMPVEKISGHIAEASLSGFGLREYPGRFFRYSAIGTSSRAGHFHVWNPSLRCS
jgi:hypothetical protein